MRAHHGTWPERPPFSFGRVCLALALAYLLQTTLLAKLHFFEVRCDLLLLVALGVALLGGEQQGLRAGFLAGLLSGYAAAWHLGSFLVSRMAAGALVGFFPKKLSTDNPGAPLVGAITGTLVADLAFLLMSPTDFPLGWWARHAVLACLLHGLCIYPVYFVLKKFLCPVPRYRYN